MPLDPVIAQGFRGIQLQDPLEQYARANQLLQAQQQNQLNALKMQEYQRGVAEQNALRTAIRPDFDPTSPEHQAELYRAAPTLAPGVIEKALLTRKTAAEIAKAKAEEGKLIGETRDRQMRTLGVALTNVLKDPSDAALSQAFSTLDAVGVDTQPFRAQFAQVPDMQARQQIITNYAVSHPEGRAALEFVKPKIMEVGTGRAKKFIDQNPNSPTFGREVIPSMEVSAAPTLKTPEEEAQAIRIAQASRPPREPREPSAPIAVVDDATGKIKYVPREEAIGKTPASALEGLAPKEIQKREAAFPQATSAIKGVEANADTFVKDLRALRNHPGLDGITGMVFGRTASAKGSSREAQALYDKIVAKGGFQMLQAMREASKTGGALGNVSNEEGRRLQAAFAAIDRVQDADSVRRAIDTAISELEGAKARAREAYESTYEYKQRGGAAPAAPKSGVDTSNPLLK